MGLDITHYKATFEKAKAHHLFYIGQDIYANTGAEIEELFKGFNVEFEHFNKYVQDIDFPTEVSSLILVDNHSQLTKAQEHFKETNRIILAYKAKEQLQEKLEQFEKKNQLSSFHKCIEKIEHAGWTILTYYSVQKKKGFYFKQVAHQRKGMNSNFDKRFCNDEVFSFAQKEDFEFAMNCVDYYWKTDTEEMVNQRKEAFKKGFIDNFEPGASFMSLSY